jgi:hypothetical protein
MQQIAKEETLYLANDAFLPFVLAELSAHPGKTGTINLRGYSMRPFLEHERDKAILALPKEPCRKNDPVLAEISPGHYVLHRIVDIDGERVTLRGDGNLSEEHCMMNDIRAVAVGFLRKGRQKPDMTSGRKWRAYSWLWTRLLPIRRWLLFALHPHIPHFLKRKQSIKQ